MVEGTHSARQGPEDSCCDAARRLWRRLPSRRGDSRRQLESQLVCLPWCRWPCRRPTMGSMLLPSPSSCQRRLWWRRRRGSVRSRLRQRRRGRRRRGGGGTCGGRWLRNSSRSATSRLPAAHPPSRGGSRSWRRPSTPATPLRRPEGRGRKGEGGEREGHVGALRLLLRPFVLGWLWLAGEHDRGVRAVVPLCLAALFPFVPVMLVATQAICLCCFET